MGNGRRGDLLVPVEPTEEMIEAIHKANDDYSNNRFGRYGADSRGEFIYRSLLNAAPSPPHDPYKALEVAREALQFYSFGEKAQKAINQINQALGDK